MATGMIQPQQQHHDSHVQADQPSASRAAESENMRQSEKQPPVAPTQILTPTEIAENPYEKKLGFSSRNLSIDEFVLLKTLGTGVYSLLYCSFLGECS